MSRTLTTQKPLFVLAVVVILSIMLYACDQQSEEVIPPTDTPTSTLPSTPTGDGLAPDGCSSGEKAYTDPDRRFALCYKSDMEVTTQGAGAGVAVTVQHPVTDSGRATATVGWSATPYVPCIEAPTVIKNRRMEKLIVDGTSVDACLEDHFDASKAESYLYTTIDFSVQGNGEKPLLVLVAYTGDEMTRSGSTAEAVALRLIDSLAVY